MKKIKTIHPFPARMAPELALAHAEALPARSIVLDPMAGSGTVLRQALAAGHNAIGFDMDPLAVLMARVNVLPIHTGGVELSPTPSNEIRLASSLSLPQLSGHQLALSGALSAN